MTRETASEAGAGLSAEALQHLCAWVGRREVIEDTLAPQPSAALTALLDHAAPAPQPGDPIPPLAHWLHFLPIHRQSELAEDGHPKRGGFMPPVPLPRRMFAGARITFHRPLHVGERAWRVGTVEQVLPKQGRSGPLVFVKVRQEISGEAGPALTEEQDIVYRTLPRPGDAVVPKPPPVEPPDWLRDVEADDRLLFRYSALLHSAHRIHFDRRYTTEVEGYPALVVQGQLIASCLADLAWRGAGRPLAAFSFRALRAVFDGQSFRAAGRAEGAGVRLWAVDAEGAQAMEAQALLADPQGDR